jgi:hypothetical protein
MNYTKPEVAVLGNAVQVIEQRTAKIPQEVLEPPHALQNAAYDLDE